MATINASIVNKINDAFRNEIIKRFPEGWKKGWLSVAVEEAIILWLVQDHEDTKKIVEKYKKEIDLE